LTDISIVTAFFDIGRGSWTADKGFPFYLARSADTYIKRFERLCQLKNEIVVFTSPDFSDRLSEIAHKRDSAKTTICTVDIEENFNELLQQISTIQSSDDFRKRVRPNLIKNPEYWNSYYVLVTNLKAKFVNQAVEDGLVNNDMVAWIDFGYCREQSNIPSSKEWNYHFDDKKIHLFSYKDKDPNKSIEDIIFNNDVHILGAKVVAHKQLWPLLNHLMQESWEELQGLNIVDDDQGLWLMSSLPKHNEDTIENYPDLTKNDLFKGF
jgi:protein YibB